MFCAEAKKRRELRSKRGPQTDLIYFLFFIFLFRSDDLNNIKLITQLATGASNSFVKLDPSFISDMGGNAVKGLTDGNAVVCSR